MNFPSNPNSAIRASNCSECGREFMACRTDLFRPDIILSGCFPDACPDCFDIHTAGHPDLARTLKEHRAHMHAYAVRYHAACG